MANLLSVLLFPKTQAQTASEPKTFYTVTHAHDNTDITVFGFWSYLMSDLILFSSLFIACAVLHTHTADGPSAIDLFSSKLDYVLIETFALLISSFTFGLGVLASYKNKVDQVIFWLIVTWLFGATFVGMEINEFTNLILEGNGPNRSAFLSSFFSLVGTHGIHVSSGLLWMIVLIVQIRRTGLTEVTSRRLACLSLFWHFLDIVWICVFSMIYLLGVV